MQGEKEEKGRNLYVHVPFCKGKCRYCAFRSEASAPAADVRDYLRLLRREVVLRGLDGARPQTVYVGGGTPSLLGADGLASLFGALPRPAPGAEITVECNPGDVTAGFAAALPALGVTRASVGVQSFSGRALRWLGRRHDADAARRAFGALREAGVESVSIDLISALPGAPEGEMEASLREAIALGPDHVSVYPLSVEPGTPLGRAGVPPPSDEAALDAVALAWRTLGEAGYERYEVSNYARPGRRCRHNLAVWLGEDYSGVGPAAWSREGLVRRGNDGSFAAWRDALAAGRLPPAEVVRATEEEDALERFATRVRLCEWDGPDPAGAHAPRFLVALRRLGAAGLAEESRDSPGRWKTTARGFDAADAMMAEF